MCGGVRARGAARPRAPETARPEPRPAPGTGRRKELVFGGEGPWGAAALPPTRPARTTSPTNASEGCPRAPSSPHAPLPSSSVAASRCPESRARPLRARRGQVPGARALATSLSRP